MYSEKQRNCPKHVEFHSKNKFEKLVHVVGFIIRMDHIVRREGFDFSSLKNAKNYIFFSTQCIYFSLRIFTVHSDINKCFDCLVCVAECLYLL